MLHESFLDERKILLVNGFKPPALPEVSDCCCICCLARLMPSRLACLYNHRVSFFVSFQIKYHPPFGVFQIAVNHEQIDDPGNRHDLISGF